MRKNLLWLWFFGLAFFGLAFFAFAIPAAENISWSTRSLSAGLVDVVGGGYRVTRVLGVANFSPELALPIEVQYQSTSEQTGILGYRWLCPQLESRVFPQNTQSPQNLQFNKNTPPSLRHPPNSPPAIAAPNSAPATVNWRTPWGETIEFIQKRTIAPDSPIALIDEKALRSNGDYFSPYNDWTINGFGGNWTVTGRADKNYAGWRFIYKNTYLTQITAPSGRTLNYIYNADRQLLAVKQNNLAFIELSYQKKQLSTITINGVKIAIDLTAIPIVTLPQNLKQKTVIVDRLSLVGLQIGDLAKQTFAYNANGWLNDLKIGEQHETLEIASEEVIARMGRLLTLSDYDQAQKKLDDALSAKERPSEAVIAKLRDEVKQAEGDVEKYAKKMLPEGTLLADNNFKYRYIFGKNANVRLTNKNQQTAVYAYDTNKGILTITNFAGLTQKLYYFRRYDVAYNGKLRMVEDARQREVIKYRYDNATGNIVSVKQLSGAELFYEYEKKDPTKLAKISRFEDNDKLRGLVQFGYDNAGNANRISLLDKAGNAVLTTELTYDRYRQVEKVQTLEGAQHFVYTNGGRVKEVTDRFGRKVSYTYDQYNRLLTQTDIYGASTVLKYNNNGQIIAIEKTAPSATEKVAIIFTYDLYGQMLSVSDNAGKTKRYERDLAGRIIKEYFPDDTAVSYEYNALGQMAQVNDQRGNPLTLAYSKFGGLAKRVTAIGQQTIYDYDKYGVLQGVKNASAARYDDENLNGEVVREFKYTYDKKTDRLTKIDFGAGQSKSFIYGDNGKLLAVREIDGQNSSAITFVYDDFDRVIKTQELLKKDGTAALTITENSYDVTGKLSLVKITFPDGLTSVRYYDRDKFGRLTAIAQNASAARLTASAQAQNEHKICYEYDEFSRVAKQTVAGTPIYYRYNERGLLTEKYILDGDGKNLASVKYEYDNHNQITAREINGVKQFLITDIKGQLIGVKNASGDLVESYVYDATGNLLTKTINGKTTKFTYDNANQLISALDDNGEETQFAYDGAGRMIKEGNKKYVYGFLDKVTAVIADGKTIAKFNYGISGQLSQVTRWGGRRYTSPQNAARFIASAQAQNGNENGNTKNNRAKNSDLANTENRESATDEITTEKFYWDGLALIRRNDTHYLNEPYATGGNPVLAWQQPRTSNRNGDDLSDNPTTTSRKNVNGKNTNGEGKNIDGENGNDIFAASDRANAQAIATQLLFNDLLGSTIAVIDGNNVNNTDITLFGEMAGNAKSGNSPNANGDSSNNHATANSEFGDSNNNIFFTGKPHIAELGYSFLFRNYRANYSKWQTADPLGYPDGLNNLAYCNNSAISNIDILGLEIIKEISFNSVVETSYGEWSEWYYNPIYSCMTRTQEIQIIEYIYEVTTYYELPWYANSLSRIIIVGSITAVSAGVATYFTGGLGTAAVAGVAFGVSEASTILLKELTKNKIGETTSKEPIASKIIDTKLNIDFKYKPE